MKVKYGPDFIKSLKRLLWFERTKFVNPKEWYRQIKWFIQRGKRGYSDQDLWNADSHIARTVLAFIEMNRMGYPMGLTEKRWAKILEEIKWLMQEVDSSTPDYELMKTEAYQTRYKKANALFAKYWHNMWD